MLSGLFISAALMIPAVGDPVGIPSGSSGPPAVIVPLVPNPGEQPEPAPLPSVPMAPMAPTAPPQMPAATSPAMAPPVRESLNDTHAGPPDHLWADVDYRLFWLRSGPLQQGLVTTPGQAAPVLGGRGVEYGMANGFGINTGLWLNDRNTFGLGFSGFMLEQRTRFDAVNSDATGNPALARPYIDALLAQPALVPIATPGQLAGGAFTAAGARLSGLELYGIRNLYYHCGNRIDLIVGGRYLDLDEFLSFTQVSQPIGTGQVVFNRIGFGPGTTLTVNDRFRTRNQFYGGTMGLRGEYHLGLGYLALSAKVGLGNNQQTVDIDGRSSISAPGVAPIPGGLLAISGANLGRQTTYRFAVLTEVGAQFGIQVTQRIRVFAGYDFLYLNNTARPGLQIDPIVNNRLVPTNLLFGTVSGLTSPVRTGARDDFFAHGVRLGTEIGF